MNQSQGEKYRREHEENVTRMKRVIYLCSVWPEPQSSAAGIRSLHLVESLRADSVEVILASHAKGEKTPPFEHFESHPIELNRGSFDQWLETLHRERPIDAVIFDRFITEEQYGWRVSRFPEIIRILDTQDLHSLRAYRELKVKELALQQRAVSQDSGAPSNSFPDAEVDLVEWKKSEHTLRELGSILRCDLTLVVSSAEKELLRSAMPPDYFHKIIYAPFPATGKAKPEEMSATRDSGLKKTEIEVSQSSAFRVGFFGNARHLPNEDAVRVLVQEVWPRFLKKLERVSTNISAQLILAGAYPPAKYQQYIKTKGVELRGSVPPEEWGDFVSGLSVLAAPLRFGAGIKGKILDALSWGIPVVTSPIGAEGLGGCWTVENAEEMAHALSVLALEPVAAQRLGAAGKIWYEQAYIPATGEQWWKNSAGSPQNRTWYQSLLQMESLGREKYFSKWIECKEKGQSGEL